MAKLRQQTDQPLGGAARGLKPTARPRSVPIGATPPSTGENKLIQLARALGPLNQVLRNVSLKTQERLSEEGMVQGALIAEKLGARATMDDLHAELKFRGVKQRKLPWVRIGAETRYGELHARASFKAGFKERFYETLGDNPKTSREDVINEVYQSAYESLTINSKNVDRGFLSAFQQESQLFNRRVDEENIKLRDLFHDNTRRDKTGEIIDIFRNSSDPNKTENFHIEINKHLYGHPLDNPGEGSYSNEMGRGQIAGELSKNLKQYALHLLIKGGKATEENIDEVHDLIELWKDILIGKGRLGDTQVFKDAMLSVYYQIPKDPNTTDDEIFEQANNDREYGRIDAATILNRYGGTITLQQIDYELAGSTESPVRIEATRAHLRKNLTKKTERDVVTAIYNARASLDWEEVIRLVEINEPLGLIEPEFANKQREWANNVKSGAFYASSEELFELETEGFHETNSRGDRTGQFQLGSMFADQSNVQLYFSTFTEPEKRALAKGFTSDYRERLVRLIAKEITVVSEDGVETIREDAKAHIRSILNDLKDTAKADAIAAFDSKIKYDGIKKADDSKTERTLAYANSVENALVIKRGLWNSYGFRELRLILSGFNPLDKDGPNYASNLQALANGMKIRTGTLPGDEKWRLAESFKSYYILVKSYSGFTYKELMEGITNEGIYFNVEDINYKNIPLFINQAALLEAFNNGVTTKEFGEIYMKFYDADKWPNMTPGSFFLDQSAAILQRVQLDREIREQYLPEIRDPKSRSLLLGRTSTSLINRYAQVALTGEPSSRRLLRDALIESQLPQQVREWSPQADNPLRHRWFNRGDVSDRNTEVLNTIIESAKPDAEKDVDISGEQITSDENKKAVVEPNLVREKTVESPKKMTADERMAADREERARRMAEDREERARKLAEDRAERE